MKCDEVLELLEDYVDESLDGVKLEGVDAHLGACRDCSAEVAAIRKENSLYAEFGERLDADPPEWRDVRAAIDPREAAPWYTRVFAGFWTPTSVLGAAAAAALILTAAIGFTVLRDQSAPTPGPIAGVPGATQTGPADRNDEVDVNPTPEPSRSVTPKKKRTIRPKRKTARPQAPSTGFPLEMIGQDARQVPALVAVAQAESTYEAAIQQLRPEYESRKRALGPEASRRLDATIRELDVAIAGTKSAVAANPGDAEAMQSLLSVYGQKVELLQDIASR